MQAQQFHTKMAIGIFKTIYPVIARNILRKSQVRKGVCIDVGGGSGMLAWELAKLSQLEVTVVDCNSESVAIAEEYFRENNAGFRLKAICASAENLPLRSNSVDLAVSRGSVFFWDDKIKGMNEIYRVLRPGGFAYIGGGMGTTKLKREITKTQPSDSKWILDNKKRFRKNLPLHLELMMRQTEIPYWTMESSDEGTWILFRK